MSVSLYRTALYWHRRNHTGAARLEGGPVVELRDKEPVTLVLPPMVEDLWYAPEVGVFDICLVHEGRREMWPHEVEWCKAILRHVCPNPEPRS